MAFKELIKNRSFILGLFAGIIVIFGSSIPLIGKIFEPIFNFVGKLSNFPEGVWGSIFNSILLVLFIFLILRLIIGARISLHVVVRFLYGFIFVWLIFLILALIAVSQFSFGF